MIVIQEQVFDSAQLTEVLESKSTGFGATVSFTGTMRERAETGDGLSGLYIEHYPAMTEQALQEILDKAKQQFNLLAVVLVHRVGTIGINEPIVYVGVTSSHRKDAFSACQMIMDYLKNDAPFWKKEIHQSGKQEWVEQKSTDRESIGRWDK